MRYTSRINTFDNSQAETPAKLLINSREAAKALGISERKLWSMTQASQIPVVRLGRSVRYSVRTLESWIEQQQSPALTL